MRYIQVNLDNQVALPVTTHQNELTFTMYSLYSESTQYCFCLQYTFVFLAGSKLV